MKKNDKMLYHQKTAEELKKLLGETNHQIVEARIKLGNGSAKDSSVFKKMRYQISLIKTLLANK